MGRDKASRKLNLCDMRRVLKSNVK